MSGLKDEPLDRKAIAISEKALPAEHPDLATSYNNLAGVAYRAQGRFAEAEPLFLKAIAIKEKVLPADHPDLATSYSNLAGLYRAEGRFAQAEDVLRKGFRYCGKGAFRSQLATGRDNPR